MQLKKQVEMPVPHATLPANERGTHSITPTDPNESARWLALADTALSRGASEESVVETEALVRNEQAVIKRGIRRTAERVKRQSKSEQ